MTGSATGDQGGAREPRGRQGRHDRLSGVLLGTALATALFAAAAAGILAFRGRAAAHALPAGPTEAGTGAMRSLRPAAFQASIAPASVPDSGGAAPSDPPQAGATPTPAPSVQPASAAPASPVAPSPEVSPSATPVPPAVSPPATAPAGGGLQGSTALSDATPQLEREHKVAPGETLTGIARQYGLSADTLIMNNAGVTDRDMLKVGQTLRIPPRDGLLYEIRYGESLATIAARYGVDPQTIVAEPANRLTSGDVIRVGQVILIPGAKMPAAPSPAPATPVATPAPIRTQQAPATAAIAATMAAPARTPAPAAPSVQPAPGGFAWPITGPITSYFGPSHPLGIDIGLYGRDGAPVHASRGGTVVFAGGNPCCSYGYYVEIDHGDGFHTLYAHFQSPPPVRIGQHVNQGDVVGYAGTTGYSTGTHLHFEVRSGGVPVNPLSYLP